MELTYLQGERDPGELPATFTVTAGDGTKYVVFKYRKQQL